MRTPNKLFTSFQMSAAERDKVVDLLQSFSEQKPQQCFYTDLALKDKGTAENPVVSYTLKSHGSVSEHDLKSFYLIMSDEHPGFNTFLDKTPTL